MQIYTVKRDGDRDLKFTGDIIADVSSHSYQGPNQNRWTEITVYRTKGGKYVVSSIGRTCWQGEHDRHDATLCDTPEAVLDALRQDGYLSWIAKEALDELQTDDAFADIYAERID
jgi:hypothetical protein